MGASRQRRLPWSAVVVVALRCRAADAAQHRRGPFDEPDTRPYDVVETMCNLGPKMHDWCKNWVECIEEKASPGNDADAVLAAWGPRGCKEVCGIWPVLAQLRGRTSLAEKKSTATAEEHALVSQASEAAEAATVARLFGFASHANTATRTDCEKSCNNFKRTLSSCVANMIFEPGKVAAMGKPKDEKPGPEVCTAKDTPCQPNLELNHQKCVLQNVRVKQGGYTMPDDIKRQCEIIKTDMDQCQECPQLSPGYSGAYTHYVGSCIDQLHAYYVATDPSAGNATIDMGETGCKPH